MAETFLIFFIGIITIVLTCLIFAVMKMSTNCNKREELWQRKKIKK